MTPPLDPQSDAPSNPVQAFTLPDWPKAYPTLNVQALFRVKDEDFQVTELSNRELKSEGPHLYLFIEKVGTNTHWLARKLANHAKLDLKDVGYAGLKDRHGITRQWFSLPLKKSNSEPDLTHLFEKDEFTLIEKGYYGVKLKRGNLGGNHFKITLRDVKGDQAEINERLELIKQRGVPNYFGPQRFGNDGENLKQAQKLFETGKRPRNRQKSSMYISAARSYLFNEMLAKRVALGKWDTPLDGEVFGFAGSLRGFQQENTTEEQARYDDKDIHPSCALWGKGEALSLNELQTIEQQVADDNPLFSENLVKQGLKQERRVARSLVPDFVWQWLDGDVLQLEFSLASGYFATSLLREIGDISEAVRFDEKQAHQDKMHQEFLNKKSEAGQQGDAS